VLKLHSETVTHKTDVGGVQLNLNDEQAVRSAFEAIKQGVSQKHSADDFLGVTVQPMIDLAEAYELIIGSSIDPQFGPVVLFGMGGQLGGSLQGPRAGSAPAQYHPGADA
jgi:acetyltransferase